jgi:Na+/H+ antiporter NhaD/arsenite permease-like protein
MNYTGIIIFVVSYIGIALGRFPGLQLDRTGVALLGAMLMIITATLGIDDAIIAVDYSTLILLFGLMILSAQFRLGGFYSLLAVRSASAFREPKMFMGALIFLSAVLSAILSNDVICLAMSPIVIEITRKRNWAPLPFLLALAASSNIGSAATLIGNPQNMYIAQQANLPFGEFLLWCVPPVLVSVVFLYLWAVRGQLALSSSNESITDELRIESALPYDHFQTMKGMFVMLVMIGLFFTNVPREITILGVASVLLMSRKLASRHFLGFVDWSLLILFIALFVLIEGIQMTGGLDAAYFWLEGLGFNLYSPVVFSFISVLLSNAVSNVPAVMLLMTKMPESNTALYYLLSLMSTFAGNFILVGSIANLIVAEQANRDGIDFNFKEHFYWTAPVALISIILAFVWWLVMVSVAA